MHFHPHPGRRHRLGAAPFRPQRKAHRVGPQSLWESHQEIQILFSLVAPTTNPQLPMRTLSTINNCRPTHSIINMSNLLLKIDVYLILGDDAQVISAHRGLLVITECPVRSSNITSGLSGADRLTTGQARSTLNNNRKFIVPILEHLDSRALTITYWRNTAYRLTLTYGWLAAYCSCCS